MGPPNEGDSITGLDEWIVAEAMATALIALEQLPPDRQPKSNMEDIRRTLEARFSPTNVSLHLAQAKIRLRPDLDAMSIYEEFGFSKPDDRHKAD